MTLAKVQPFCSRCGLDLNFWMSKTWMKVEYFLRQLKRETSVRIYIKIISVSYENQIEKLEKSTRRAQIPQKPLDPPIFWIVTQSLIFQIVDAFCVFACTQIYKRPFLWSFCVSVQQWCRQESLEIKILGWIPGDHEML